MFWFNKDTKQLADNYTKFQYIRCFGSIMSLIAAPIFRSGFQYIRCFGSIISRMGKELVASGFNTLDVLVQ